MSTTNIPKKEDKKQIGNQMGDMGNTFYCRAGDLGNTFIAGLVIWGTPPFAKPHQNPLYTAPPQNALSQSRVSGAWLGFVVARLAGWVLRWPGWVLRWPGWVLRWPGWPAGFCGGPAGF